MISLKKNILKINKEFQELGTRTIDERNRLTIGPLLKGSKRVKIFKNDHGDLLLQPLVEVPASELWVFENKEVLKSLRKGLRDAASGRLSKLNPEDI